jgi:hypothetical protein
MSEMNPFVGWGNDNKKFGLRFYKQQNAAAKILSFLMVGSYVLKRKMML